MSRFMRSDSRNAEETTAICVLKVTTPGGFEAARRSGLEWHHLAGHNGTNVRVGVYVPRQQTDAERKANDAKLDAIFESNEAAKDAKHAAKAAGMPTSKAAAWRWILDPAHQVPEGSEALEVPARNGKHGWFRASFAPTVTFRVRPDEGGRAAVELVS